MNSLKMPPKTTMEAYKMLPEGTLAEIINGSILMSPAPTPAHQRTTRELSYAILNHLKQHKKGGQIFFAPCDVFSMTNLTQYSRISFLFLLKWNRLLRLMQCMECRI